MRVRWLAFPAVLLFVMFTLGCGGNSTPNPATKTDGPKVHQEEEHAHPEEGPHHGHLIELGQEEYHAELVHNDASKTVTIYVLDSSAQAAVAIEEPEVKLNLVVDGQPQQFTLPAAPQSTDAAGKSSLFSLQDEALLAALESPKATGRLNITIAGKSYSGVIDHHDHEGHAD